MKTRKDRYSQEKRRTYTNMYRTKRKLWARSFLGNQCVECSSTENLEFHHKDPKIKLMPIGKMWTASRKKFLDEIEKCELLCRSCHLVHHYA